MTKIKVDVELLKEKHNREMDAKRKEAYAKESDHLFFKVQRNEIPFSDWENKIQEIKDRFPRK